MQFVNRTKLVEAMARMGMKRKQLAQELGITPANLTLKIKGERMFGEREIACLSMVFGACVLELNYGKKR